MKRRLLLALILAAPLPAVAGDPPAVDLPLRRVTLHSGGKGVFEYRGGVSGRGVFELPLPIGTEDKAEILRASRIDDPAGPARVVTPNAGRPERRLPKFERLRDALDYFKGTEVSVRRAGQNFITGRLVAAEYVTELITDGAANYVVVTIESDGALVPIILDESMSIAPTDEDRREVFADVLERMSRTEDGESSVEFRLADGGDRDVGLSVSRVVPVWKTAYTLSGERLVHRAVVDNVSGDDWDGVTLTLADGDPVLFRIDLARIVAPELDTQDVPRRGRDVIDAFAAADPPAPQLKQGYAAMGRSSSRLMAEAAPAAAADFAMSMGGTAQPSPAADAPAASTLTLTFDDVTVGDGETILLDTPLVDVAVTRSSIYRKSADATRPLLSLRIKNTGDTLIPPGPITVTGGESGGVVLGEAMVPTVAPEEERIVAYAVDGGVRVRHDVGETETSIKAMTIRDADHRIELTTRVHREHEYRLANRSGEARTVTVEHPEPGGRFEVETDAVKAESERAGSTVRFTTPLADGETFDLTVPESFENEEAYDFLNFPIDRLNEYADAEELDPATRDRLREILENRRSLSDIQRQLTNAEKARTEAAAEVSRLTNQLTNARRADLPGELVQKYRRQVVGIEQRLDGIDQTIQKLRSQESELRRKLGDVTVRPFD